MAHLAAGERTGQRHLQPPLKWAGGKRWLLDTLRPIWAPHVGRRLVEPFAGGLAVTLGLQPKSALINDINPHLINFYQHLQCRFKSSVTLDFSPEVYYARRAKFNQLISAPNYLESESMKRRAAMLFYYLNRHCYNGICRFNQRGEFNTPLGRFVHPRYDRDLTHYAPVMRNWEFTSGDFGELETRLRPTDFIYADPPYHEAWDKYQGVGFSEVEHERLARWLAEHEGPVVISNNATKKMVNLYEKYGFDTRIRVWSPRMIKFRGNPKRIEEVVATRNV